MITLNRKDLLAELSLLSIVTGKEKTIPVLSFAKAIFSDGILRLTATDLDVTIDTELPAQGDGWEGCLPISQLKALCRLLNEDTLTLEPKPNDRVQVKSERSRHLLLAVSVDGFPSPEKLPEGEGFTVDGERLREGLRRAIPCVDTEEGRWTLQGINFEVKDNLLNLVAANGHRMILTVIPVEAPDNLSLVPPAALASLLAMDVQTVKIRTSDNRIVFDCGQRAINSRLLVGRFPEWRMFMPKDTPHEVEIPVEGLKAALRRAQVTRQETHKTGTGKIYGGVKLSFASNSLTVSVPENDRGAAEETLPVTSDLNGDVIEMGIDPDYLQDFLARAGEKITWQMKDGESHQLLIDGDYQYVVMPRRL